MLSLNGQPITIQEIAEVAYGRMRVTLSAEARHRVEQVRHVVEEIVAEG